MTFVMMSHFVTQIYDQNETNKIDRQTAFINLFSCTYVHTCSIHVDSIHVDMHGIAHKEHKLFALCSTLGS